MTKRQAAMVNLGMAVVAVSVTLVLTEGALRLFYPTSDRHYVLLPGQTVTMTPLREYVEGVSGEGVHRTSSDGIRGNEFGADDDYRILAIGGSTTQNAYLDQSETWTLAVGNLLNDAASGIRTWTGDVGRSGHTARSHVLQFEYIVPELPEIDAVMMLVGVNDLTVALRMGFEYEPEPPLTDPEARSAQLRQAFIQVPGGLRDRSTAYQGAGVNPVKRLATYQLARLAREAWRQRRGGTRQDRFGEIYATWRGHRATTPQILDTLPDLTQALSQYRGYLEEMARTAVDRDVRLLLITQPTLWRDDLTDRERALLWLGGTGDFQSEPEQAYFSVRALWEAMDAYNETLMSVCDDYPIECLDLASALPRDTTVFYDDVHFTERGSRLVAEYLAEYLGARPPYAAEPPS